MQLFSQDSFIYFVSKLHKFNKQLAKNGAASMQLDAAKDSFLSCSLINSLA